uniref:protein-lysine N-methyltransferase EEF2KMT-like n=1 Tax=Oncorhynchus gorbuscha TaxID=8017 RepID=UPI001EAF4195|nr:protein-lysine N-methyltransferase EEF2KMT-like [Oncorhynchus gorbuscha]XP_046195690.1 protein-lysine N-methyltransferase EEF2KMT-like [Oncorhynchus gorbuscha]
MNEMYLSKGQTDKTEVTCIRNRADVIYDFKVSFFTMGQLPNFPWNSLERELETDSSSEMILDILKQTCLHPLCCKHPPSVRYRRLFLSQLIKRHEASGRQPLDELYDALGEVLGVEEGTECYKSYLLPCGEAVSLSESTAVISEGTTGLVTWEAALYLAEWALENTHAFTDRTVLELGSGVGLTGIAVCRSCSPSSYVFSDCHLSVLHRLRDNVQLNGLDNQNSPRVSVEHLDWEEVTEKQLREIGAATVIAADVVYDPDIIGCLVQLLSKILRCSANGSPPDVYISSTIRNPDTYNSFKHQLESSGIQHEVMTGPVTHVFFYNRQATIEMIKLYI